jgi:phage terminase large subunit
MILDPDLKIVCIREIQKSLQFSGFQLIKDKIQSMGVSAYFDIVKGEIRRKGGNGLMIFQGMQDHTADSIKGLEGFRIAWCEEAQNLSKRSLDLLRPTIMRNKGYEMWFTWNPDQPDDPIEKFHEHHKDKGITVHVNYDQNPFLDKETIKEIEEDKVNIPDDFDHVWLGGYNLRSDIRVFRNWTTEECEPTFDDELYYGADWGFSQDPTTLLRCWIREDERRIYIDHQIDGVGVEVTNLPEFFDRVPDSRKYRITADSARPEIISHMKNAGFNIAGSIKGKGSVESGIDWLRGYEIVVHPRCKLLQKELRLYSYKLDKVGNILPQVDDKAGLDHCIDALRYALEKIIKAKKGGGFYTI